jgi:galactose-1-phosphate uridylyltransferase
MTVADLPSEAVVDLFTLIKQAVEEYEFPGGSFFMRFGEGKYNGSSVRHLHAQLLMGDADDPQHQSVKVKLG